MCEAATVASASTAAQPANSVASSTGERRIPAHGSTIAATAQTPAPTSVPGREQRGYGVVEGVAGRRCVRRAGEREPYPARGAQHCAAPDGAGEPGHTRPRAGETDRAERRRPCGQRPGRSVARRQHDGDEGAREQQQRATGVLVSDQRGRHEGRQGKPSGAGERGDDHGRHARGTRGREWRGARRVVREPCRQRRRGGGGERPARPGNVQFLTIAFARRHLARVRRGVVVLAVLGVLARSRAFSALFGGRVRAIPVLGFGAPAVVLDPEVDLVGVVTSDGRPWPPRFGDDAGVVADPARDRRQRASQLLESPSLARARAEREVDRLAQLARKLAALPAQRRQMHPHTTRGLARGPGPNRVDAGQALVQHEREREQIGRCAGREPLGLLGRHVRGRPDHIAGHRQRVATSHARDAEIGQPRESRR